MAPPSLDAKELGCSARYARYPYGPQSRPPAPSPSADGEGEQRIHAPCHSYNFILQDWNEQADVWVHNTTSNPYFGIPQSIALVIGIGVLLWSRRYIYRFFIENDHSQPFIHKHLLFRLLSIAIVIFSGLALITFVSLVPTRLAMSHWYDQQNQHLLANHCSFDDIAKLNDASGLHQAHAQFYQVGWILIELLFAALGVLMVFILLTLILTSRNAAHKHATD